MDMLSSIYKGIDSNITQNQTENTENNVQPFGDIITSKLNQLNDLQVQADEGSTQLALGNTQNVHDVLIQAEEAKLALELAVQIRNKVVDAYQEIIKMQI